MTQKYKAVYFPEHPGGTSQKKSLTLAFGKKTAGLYESVKGLSSAELRMLLKEDYQALVSNAEADDLPLNHLLSSPIKALHKSYSGRSGST